MLVSVLLAPILAATHVPTCREARSGQTFEVHFEKVDLDSLVQAVADATCRTFVVSESLKGKISVVGPENGNARVNANEFLSVFIAALDANGLALVESGQFSRVVEKSKAKSATPIVTGALTSDDERLVTRFVRVKYVEVESVRAVLSQLVTPQGDVIGMQPDLLIITDLASNQHRLEQLLTQLDAAKPNDESRVISLQYVTVNDFSDKVMKLTAQGVVKGAPQLSFFGDERTNKLFVWGSPTQLARVDALVQALDVPLQGDTKLTVLPLQFADATDLSGTLQQLSQNSSSKGSGPGARPQVAASVDLLSGDVKVTPDKQSNSLIIVASPTDLRALLHVIEQLDLPRRQVFIEAAILEVNLDRQTDFGVNWHLGDSTTTSSGTITGVMGTKYSTSTGLPPSMSATSIASLAGTVFGIQGPSNGITIGGVTIPSFGVVVNALQTSSDVNVLSTPHLLTSDNEEAEISVGQNVPFQTGYSTGTTTSTAVGSISRQNVEQKLTIKPQINQGNRVRLTLTEHIEEIASTDATLGPTTSKRQAKSTIIVKDDETAVLAGIMQERVIESESKVPFLGDIPLLGHLFRTTSKHKVKTNLLLVLTPHIIRTQADMSRLLEKKMKERQALTEQFYGGTNAYDLPIDYGRKPGPLAVVSRTLAFEASRPAPGAEPTDRLISPSREASSP